MNLSGLSLSLIKISHNLKTCFLAKLIMLRAVLFLFFCSIFSFNSFAQIAPVTTDSRIKTLVYNANEVYELKFYYGYQSFIEFGEDEEIEMISIGESFAWRLTPAGKRLFIRPLEIAGHTNMTIITNKRTYHFDIRSGEYDGRADEELVYTVRFFYPQIGQPLPIPPALAVPNPAGPPPAPKLLPIIAKPQPVIVKPAQIKSTLPSARVDYDLPGIIERNPDHVQLNFDYSIAGRSDNITPTKVYDDGKSTSFQFANDNLVIPSINLVDAHGREHPLTYVIIDGFVTVRATGRQFTLRLADSLICVYNNKMIR